MPPNSQSEFAGRPVIAPSSQSAPPRQSVSAASPLSAAQPKTPVTTAQPQLTRGLPSKLSSLPLPLVIAAASSLAAVSTLVWFVRGRKRSSDQQSTRQHRRLKAVNKGASADQDGAKAGDKGQASSDDTTTKPGPFSRLKATSRCVPLSDGSACVVRREIPADNSCLFNAVGYCMHHSKTRASFLRSVVAREVSSHPDDYTPVFLGMHNAEYCSWIENRMNWGGAIELSILVKHYNREIAAWNVETAKCHTFGEEAGFPKQVMVIYTGSHYDALAIAAGPKAPDRDDILEFNPRTKRGKMILAAAKKLAELTHQGSKFYRSTKLKCSACGVVVKNQVDAAKHAEKTGHDKFEEAK